MWFLEYGLKLDMNAKPESPKDSLLTLVAVLPVIPIMLASILVAGLPWMFVMSRVLSRADIRYFTKQNGNRVPWLSDWLDRVWERMIESRKNDGNERDGGF